MKPLARSVLITPLLVISTLPPAAATEDPKFRRVILDDAYIAYERDVGDIDGDGDNDLVAVQEGDTTLQVFRAPTWKRSTLVSFTGTDRYPRADDLKLADIDGDGDLDVVTRLGNAPTSDAAGIAVWCENLGGGAKFTQHLIGKSLEYVKDIVVADFDRDGRLDVAMRMDSRTQLWLQDAAGWSEVVLSPSSPRGDGGGRPRRGRRPRPHPERVLVSDARHARRGPGRRELREEGHRRRLVQPDRRLDRQFLQGGRGRLRRGRPQRRRLLPVRARRPRGRLVSLAHAARRMAPGASARSPWSITATPSRRRTGTSTATWTCSSAA